MPTVDEFLGHVADSIAGDHQGGRHDTASTVCVFLKDCHDLDAECDLFLLVGGGGEFVVQLPSVRQPSWRFSTYLTAGVVPAAVLLVERTIRDARARVTVLHWVEQ